MGRPRRTQAGGFVYHVLNRANRRAQIFAEAGDYAAFLRALADAQREHPMRLVAYCVLPNHWHLVLWPEQDGSLSRFVGWLTLTHTQRWHAYRGTVGSGHLYQGRFKSFAVETDEHLLTVGRYVERNALRAGLVKRAEDWPWGSLGQRVNCPTEVRPQLAEGPIPLRPDWTAWVAKTVQAFGLQSTQRRPGRPARPSAPGQLLLFDENGSSHPVFLRKRFLTPGVSPPSSRHPIARTFQRGNSMPS